MEQWELAARESIRDLVARYNANGDSGRFTQMMDVFANDAVMENVSQEGERQVYSGKDAIVAFFTSIKDAWSQLSIDRSVPYYIRHFTTTHQIDFHSETSASGRLYFAAILPHGLDHWGRYIDEYEQRDEKWVIVRRRAITDGAVASGFVE